MDEINYEIDASNDQELSEEESLKINESNEKLLPRKVLNHLLK